MDMYKKLLTPDKMHMSDMEMIALIVLEILGQDSPLPPTTFLSISNISDYIPYNGKPLKQDSCIKL